MLTPGLFVWADFVNVPKDAALVEAVGRQWNWSFRFPGKDGALGATSAKLTTPDNPFGIDPDDPKGRDDVLIPGQELHLPIGKPVKILLRSTDVLHDFTVPQFRVKMDLVPGMVTHVWLTPTKAGTYEILCEELCGIAHFAMRGRVVVDEDASFDTWLASQATFADTVARVAGDPAAGQATYATCMACHGAQGEGNQLLNAPKLAGQPGWYLARQLHNFKQGLRGASSEDTFGQQMVGFAGMLDDTATRNLIAYLATLPDSRPQTTLAGDAARGETLYAHLRGLSRGRRRRHLDDQRAAPGAHERLVSGTAAEEFPAGHSRRPSAGFLRRADGLAGKQPERRERRRRRHGLYQHAEIRGADAGVERPADRHAKGRTEIGFRRGLADGLRCNRRPGRAPARPADFRHQVHLEPGPQGHRDPVRRHGDRRGPGGPGAVRA